MTLHDTAEISKKVAIAGSIGLGVILLVVIAIRIGKAISASLNPPKIAPPNEAYGKLPAIVFPQSSIKGNYSYSVNTVNGSLPDDFPDRVIVYPMIIPQPNLLNLDNTKKIIANLGFTDQFGNTLPEIPRGGPTYEWDEPNGFQRKIIYNIVTNTFTLSSNYLTSLTVLNAQALGDQNAAVSTVQSFLESINSGSFPTDIDLTLTQNPSPDIDYTTTPQLYSIISGQLNLTSSLSNTQVIRVDLYQQEVDYSLTAGQNQNLSQIQNFDLKMPVMYPHPPYSTMNFLVASGINQAMVVSSTYNHQVINLQPDNQATYPIKTAQQAFDDLKNGKGYIGAYNGNDSQILINKVYLAYFIGDSQQDYLEPVVVFEGQNGFFAYVPAITDEALQ
jgi:hypothetical protein